MLAGQDAAEGLTDEDAVPDLAETPVSIAGDFWILGNHKLLVGDAFAVVTLITPVRKNIKGNLRAAIQAERQLAESSLFYAPDKSSGCITKQFRFERPSFGLSTAMGKTVHPEN